MVVKKILEFLRDERLNKCLEQTYLTEKLGVDENITSRWESGQTAITFLQMENYASALETSVRGMLARLASNGQDLLRPITEVHVEVYTKETYSSLMQYLTNSGMDIIIKNTKLKRWEQ